MDNLPIIDPDSGQESLEGSTTVVEPVTNVPQEVEDQVDNTPTVVPTAVQKRWWNRLFSHINIYLVMFLVILGIGITIVVIAYLNNQRSAGTSSVKSQSLSQSTFQELANSNASVGSSNQVLTVQSSAIFAGKVLAKQDLEVAGNLHLGGALAINDLAVAGATSLQGAVTIAKSLQVNGGGTFGGPLSAAQITTSNLQLNGDLNLTHHLVTGGGTPNKTDGNGLGGGGTTSVSGNDTGGSVTINTGNNPAVGCFITVNFNGKFSTTPRVLLTPVNGSSAGINYYVTRSSTNFSICSINAAPANTTFGFDYFVFI